MTKINTEGWKEYRVGDIFTQERGKEKAPKQNEAGDCPLIQETNTDNGFCRMVKPTQVFPGNAITISINYATNVFYQPKPFCASVNIAILYNDNLNLRRGQFVAAILSSINKKYDYNNKINKDKINDTIIKLPATTSGEIDWNYIEEFMASCEGKASNNVERVRRGEAEPHSLVDTSKWGSFKISELFNVSRPAARSQNSYSEGVTPFVASGNINNGVVRYCQPADGELLDKGNCITVSPLDGSSFYQRDDFLGRGGAGSAIIILRNEKLNTSNAMFVCAVLRATLNKCSYSDQLSSSSIINQVIKLPVSPDGSPNFAYMENYIENLKRSI